MNEKYSKYVTVVNGRECWKTDFKGNSYRDVLENDLDEAFKFLQDDLENIRLFSTSFLMKNKNFVQYVIDSIMDNATKYRIYTGKDVINAIPYQVLCAYYNDIRKKVEKDGLLLSIIPDKLQEDYLAIPMEAVKENPSAIRYASEKALFSYPDISQYAVRKCKNLKFMLPVSVSDKYKDIL